MMHACHVQCRQAWLILTILVVTTLAVEPPDISSCSPVGLGAGNTSLVRLSSGCFTTDEGQTLLQDNLEIIGQPDGSAVLDLEWRAVSLGLGGHELKLTNITIVRTLLMWRAPLRLVPMYMDSHTAGSSVELDNVTVHMFGRCDIEDKVSGAFGDVAVNSEDGSSVFIPFSDSGVARASRITVQCDADGSIPEPIPMETSNGAELLHNLIVLDQTREIGLFRVTGTDISLQDADWPESLDSLPGLFRQSTIQGFRTDEADRFPVFDFGLVPKVMRISKGGPRLLLKDLILTNLFEEPWTDSAARDPLALFSLSFHGFLMERGGGAKILVKDCSIVVSEFELKVFAYWGAFASTDGTPHLDKIAPFINSLRVDHIRMTPTGNGNLLIREISELRAVALENVTLTTEYPSGAPERLRTLDGTLKGDPPAIYSVEFLPLVEVRNGSSLLQSLLDTSRDKQLLEADPRVILATPRLNSLTVDVRIQQASNGSQTLEAPGLGPAAGTPNASIVEWPSERVVLENNVLIETRQDRTDFHTLDMGFVESLLEITGRPVVLQYLHLTNMYAPCAQPDCEPGPLGLKVLPAFFLWPVLFNRSNTLLFVDSCTMALPARDFELLRELARAGSLWQQSESPMAAFLDSFQVLSMSSKQVNIQSFEGSGLSGTRVNVTLNPCISAECQLHEERAAGEVVSPAPVSDQKGDGSRADVLGPAIAVPVGVVVLGTLASVLALLLVRRKRRLADAHAQKSSANLSMNGKYADEKEGLPSSYHNSISHPDPSENGRRHANAHPGGAAVMFVNSLSRGTDRKLEGMEGDDITLGAVQIEVHDKESPIDIVLPQPMGSHPTPRTSFHIGTRVHAARPLPMCSTTSSHPFILEQRGGEGQGLQGVALSQEQANLPPPLVHIQQLVQELKTEHLVIQRQLGQGGFGTVYQGTWRNLPVAVKVICFSSKANPLPSTKEDEQAPGEDALKKEAFNALGQEQAVLEAAVTSCIYHPNVVTVYHYDISEIKGDDATPGLRGLQVQSHQAVKLWKLYLIQEFMEAGDLTDAVHRYRFFHSEDGLPYLDFVVQLLLDVAYGMEHVHSRSIIHGDLNPNNILLKFDESKPSNLRAKVADFGACHLLKQGRAHVSNVQVGTPFYMDPSTRATGRCSSASDVFSFGVIMWELFCGRTPFVPDNTGDMVKAPDFPSFPPGTPPIFVNLALQCLSIKPSQRPSFAQCQKILLGLQDHLMAPIVHGQGQEVQ